MKMTTPNTLAAMRERQIKRDIQHLTKPLWRMAYLVIVLILVSGIIFRAVHVAAKAEVKHVNDSR